MPGVQPAELWRESGRWDHYGRELLRFKDRHDHDYCLAPTHEEVITDLVRREVRSYRDMPLNLYQFQTKFRDEIRPRFGVMRSREFIMKDGYSFDPDDESSAASYQVMHQAYSAVFNRLGLEFAVVEADSGAIGGSFSHEFMVLADTGEDAIASCQCGWAANFEKAEVALPQGEEPEAVAEVTQVDTPGAHTVEEVAGFLKVSPGPGGQDPGLPGRRQAGGGHGARRPPAKRGQAQEPHRRGRAGAGPRLGDRGNQRRAGGLHRAGGPHHPHLRGPGALLFRTRWWSEPTRPTPISPGCTWDGTRLRPSGRT